MNLLGIDTSSLACSVALQHGDDIIERHEEQAREHTRLLVPMIRAVLEEAGLSTAGLDAIVLGNGPGSFIGMRIAASVAQGLAHGAGIAIVPVSSRPPGSSGCSSTPGPGRCGSSTEIVACRCCDSPAQPDLRRESARGRVRRPPASKVVRS